MIIVLDFGTATMVFFVFQERSFISSSIPAATAYAVFISQLMLLVGITARKLYLKVMNLVSTLVREP
jgi:hypothetical protein